MEKRAAGAVDSPLTCLVILRVPVTYPASRAEVRYSQLCPTVVADDDVLAPDEARVVLGEFRNECRVLNPVGESENGTSIGTTSTEVIFVSVTIYSSQPP